MRASSRRAIQLSLVVGALTSVGNYFTHKAASQDAGWITLFDGKSLNGWDQVGESNWHVEDGAIVVDKMAGKDAGYLVTKNSYKNFVVRVSSCRATMPIADFISAASIPKRSPTAPAMRPISSISALTRPTAPARSPAMSRSIRC